MKSLEQNEIFQNLSNFLKTRGIELKDGSYAQGIQKSCSLLTDAINLGQQSWERARVEVDKSLDQVRQTIHAKTAPKKPKTSEPPPKAQAKQQTRAAGKKPPTRKVRKSSRG